jgi:hypothetical protein
LQNVLLQKEKDLMKKPVGLLTAFMFACVVVSAIPVSACNYCWFTKCIKDGSTWYKAPTTVTTTVGEDVYWTMAICVDLRWVTVPGAIEDVVVTDRFGAEIEIVEIMRVSHGTATYSVNGNSEKVTLTWNIGTLPFGERATIKYKISTDLNPAGHQEYTSPGCYELNSGAVLKFTYNGKQHSANTPRITVSVTP